MSSQEFESTELNSSEIDAMLAAERQVEFPSLDDVSEEPVIAEKRPDPVRIIADAMVRAAIRQKPEIAAAGVVRGALVILVCPEGWPDFLARSWRTIIVGQPEDTDNDDNYQDRSDRRKERLRWPLETSGAINSKGLQKLDGEILHALRSGRGILCSTSGLDKVMPPLRAAADLTVTIPLPTPAMVAAVAEFLGNAPGHLVQERLAAAVQPDHLVAACRPEGSAAAYLDRLCKVIEADLPRPVTFAEPAWTLDRLHGNAEVKAFAEGLAIDMKAYIAGVLPWEEVSPGVLLAGPPGCGKTVTAAAIAFACGVRFIATSYSEWQGAGKEGHLGELTKCLRGKFAEARANAPCILFLDELDSVRARGTGRHDDWWTPITNCLLEEMDGCQARPGVVVIAASNHPGKIDPALRRSGRLDKEILLTLPDEDALVEILKEYLEGFLRCEDLRPVARAALGGSGADVARWVRTARQAARHAGRPLTLRDLISEIKGAAEPPTHARLRRVAYHEAGHALCCLLERPGDLRSISIRRGYGGVGTMGGVSALMPQPGADSPADLAVMLRYTLGGRAAEEVVYGVAGGGCGGPVHSDLAVATLLAASAEAAWGMGDMLTWRGDPDPDTLPAMLAMNKDIAVRVEARLREALDGARKLLKRHRPALDALAAALTRREAITGDEAAEVVSRTTSGRMKPDPVSAPVAGPPAYPL